MKGATKSPIWRIKLHQAQRRAKIIKGWFDVVPSLAQYRPLTVYELDNQQRLNAYEKRRSDFLRLHVVPRPDFILRAE